MSQTITITITIDKRQWTITAKEVQSLLRIARDIDRVGSMTWCQDPSRGHVAIHCNPMKRLGKWLDTHGPEGGAM